MGTFQAQTRRYRRCHQPEERARRRTRRSPKSDGFQTSSPSQVQSGDRPRRADGNGAQGLGGGQDRRTVEGKCSLQEHRRPQNQSFAQRLRKVQAVEGQEGPKSRDQQGLLRSPEGGKSINKEEEDDETFRLLTNAIVNDRRPNR